MSVGSPGDVAFDAAAQMPDINLARFTRLGRIDLSDEAFLTTTGSPTGPGGNGTVLIRGGRLVMTGTSAISANSVGNVDGARVGIDVRVSGDVVIDNSIVETRSLGAGRGGDLVLSGTTVALQNGGVQTETVASAPGGDLTLTAGRLTFDKWRWTWNKRHRIGAGRSAGDQRDGFRFHRREWARWPQPHLFVHGQLRRGRRSDYRRSDGYERSRRRAGANAGQR